MISKYAIIKLMKFSDVDLSMSAAKDSACPEAAYRYLSLLLSPDAQTKVAETAFPVVREAVEHLLIPGYHYYLPTTYTVPAGADAGKTAMNVLFDAAKIIQSHVFIYINE